MEKNEMDNDLVMKLINEVFNLKEQLEAKNEESSRFKDSLERMETLFNLSIDFLQEKDLGSDLYLYITIRKNVDNIPVSQLTETAYEKIYKRTNEGRPSEGMLS